MRRILTRTGLGAALVAGLACYPLTGVLASHQAPHRARVAVVRCQDELGHAAGMQRAVWSQICERSFANAVPVRMGYDVR